MKYTTINDRPPPLDDQGAIAGRKEFFISRIHERPNRVISVASDANADLIGRRSQGNHHQVRRLASTPSTALAAIALDSIDLTADDSDDPYEPGTARPRAYQRFTGAVEPEEIEEAAEPADFESPASEAASGSAFAGAEGSQDAEFDDN
ncbi:hypothetical protein MY4824_002083 [Beauveria thailandica]